MKWLMKLHMMKFLLHHIGVKKTVHVPFKEKVEREKNDLDKIMRDDILTTIDKFPRILELFFNQSYPIDERMWAEERVCEAKEGDDVGHELSWKKRQESFISQTARYFNFNLTKLQMESDQLEKLFIYPNVIEHLLHIIVLRPDIENLTDLFKSAAKNPIVLKQVLFDQSQSIHQLDSKIKTGFFGGAYQGSNLNPFTGKSNCPPNFMIIKIFADLNICVSNDQELLWPVRFGGFHHCESDIQMCPRGYSQYLGGIHNECEYYYCIRFGTRHIFPSPVVNKPPYINYERALAETTKTSSSS
uniref:Uncharacterized protein n=1 Tax=Panagrolaimus davidi TaxID=227884 RepID=A0A914QPU1_9BILA